MLTICSLDILIFTIWFCLSHFIIDPVFGFLSFVVGDPFQIFENNNNNYKIMTQSQEESWTRRRSEMSLSLGSLNDNRKPKSFDISWHPMRRCQESDKSWFRIFFFFFYLIWVLVLNGVLVLLHWYVDEVHFVLPVFSLVGSGCGRKGAEEKGRTRPHHVDTNQTDMLLRGGLWFLYEGGGPSSPTRSSGKVTSENIASLSLSASLSQCRISNFQ